VYLTSTHAVGRVYDGAVRVAVDVEPRVGTEDFVIPVVGECDDSWLSEGRIVQVEAEDVTHAVAAAAGGPVAEGAVGAGTGMMTKGYKAGIGTASRIAPSIGGAVGVLVLSNFYPPPALVMDGVPVGELLGEPPDERRSKAGSCIAVVAVDAPLSAHQLVRVARRAGLGLARCGFRRPSRQRRDLRLVRSARPPPARRGSSGERARQRPQRRVRGGGRRHGGGGIERLVGCPDVVGREGRVGRALPHDDVLEILAAHGRLDR
jgi:D-aminopeptidase